MTTLSRDPSELEFLEGLADRIALAVEAIPEAQGEIARRIGVSSQRLSNWTGRQNRPDWFAVAKLCKLYGISADWLLFGDQGGLRVSMAESLARAEAGKLAVQPGRARRYCERP